MVKTSERRNAMVKVGLFVRLEAKPGKEKAGDLFSKPPVIEKIDVLAAKLPA
jgi:hypothetical protein